MGLSEEDVLIKHVFMEAVGGYIECSCGWPTKAQYDAGEYEVVHVLADLVDNGLIRHV